MTEERIENVPVGVDAIKAAEDKKALAAVASAAAGTTPATSSNLIRQIYLCTVVDADGRERLLSTITSRGMMPMMSVDEGERGKLEEAAQEIANTSGAKVRIVRLTGSEVVRVIERQLVRETGAPSGLLGPDGKPVRASQPMRALDATPVEGAGARPPIDIRGIAGGGSTVDAASRGMLGTIKKDGGKDESDKGSGGKIGGGAKIGG